MGTLLCKSGRPKFTRPSPPKVVPSKLNKAWFWLIGKSCPLHSAHPLGAKPKLKILISERNGSAIVFYSIELVIAKCLLVVRSRKENWLVSDDSAIRFEDP